MNALKLQVDEWEYNKNSIRDSFIKKMVTKRDSRIRAHQIGSEVVVEDTEFLEIPAFLRRNKD